MLRHKSLALSRSPPFTADTMRFSDVGGGGFIFRLPCTKEASGTDPELTGRPSPFSVIFRSHPEN
jgi:hypothetical protein